MLQNLTLTEMLSFSIHDQQLLLFFGDGLYGSQKQLRLLILSMFHYLAIF